MTEVEVVVALGDCLLRQSRMGEVAFLLTTCTEKVELATSPCWNLLPASPWF